MTDAFSCSLFVALLLRNCVLVLVFEVSLPFKVMLLLSNFIDNEFVVPTSGLYLDNVEPATGHIYGSVPRSNADDVNRAVAAAKTAFVTWKKTTAKERSALLYRIADLIEKKIDVFAAAESRDTGKPLSVAKTVDIARVIDNFRFYAGAILHHENQSTQLVGQAVLWSVNQPIGVCALISPWNLPLYLLSWKIAPALAMGNTCVCKPSEFTSVSGVASLLHFFFPAQRIYLGECMAALRSVRGSWIASWRYEHGVRFGRRVRLRSDNTSRCSSRLVYWWHGDWRANCSVRGSISQETKFGTGRKKRRNRVCRLRFRQSSERDGDGVVFQLGTDLFVLLQNLG
jgi:hypothetical protein